ncbi:hypothetical protein PR202_gb16864 [Eleusine coracana subsp. coracana]|uniref:TF-B3 domain-containing protein n=1 Tax=Eleusine coracana subsp. coracana TaxID=191504 RepID=A0AAV5F1G9_ELECO|nr:hypothetical protein PR202_gb16864 [Eleusine coracana subsp. coracana]
MTRSRSAAAAKERETEKGRDGRKEKQNGREQRKDTEGREEATEVEATTAAGRKFFKVFFPDQSGERLEYLEEEPNRQVSLKGPSGKTWQVTLISDSHGLGFTEGWKEFAHHHSLMLGHFLVFTYDGHSQFSVAVFCQSGVEDKLALDVQPYKKVLVKREEERAVVDADVAGTSEVSAPPVEGNGTTRKRVRQVNDVMENGAALKRHSSAQKKPEKRKPEATIDTSKAAPTVVNNNKDFSGMLVEYACSNKTLVRSKENIPCEFVRQSLPQTCKKMTLWDPQGKSWEVNYVYYTGRSVAAFSGGWGKFAVGNNLEKFDVCIFELFKEDNIKVHIYRVVPEITPLIRSSSSM